MGWITKMPKKVEHECPKPDPNAVGPWSVWKCEGWRGCGKEWTVMALPTAPEQHWVAGNRTPPPPQPRPPSRKPASSSPPRSES